MARGFRDREEAGRRLAGLLDDYRGGRPVVLGLPRGGIPVAKEVAKALDAELDVLVIRKLGCPGRPELGIGAVGEGDEVVLNTELIERLGITREQVDRVVRDERAEVARRLATYREGPGADVTGRTVVVVDDGLATGYTARAALELVRARGAARVVLAVPVAPPQTLSEMRRFADDVICVLAPPDLMSIGEWYDDFHQLSDREVGAILRTNTVQAAADDVTRTEVVVRAEGVTLPGTLSVPARPRGIVLFAHGSGSSRTSPRNVAVADHLNREGFATLLFDLLTPREERDRSNVFDIRLLGSRLVGATQWVREQPGTRTLPVGYFGASTGAGAALWAAAVAGDGVSAVVSRGGRPDLAGPRLGLVTAPVLLIVGGRDTQVLELNEQARERLRCPSEIQVVPGATHLFEEPGALDAVAILAAGWFGRHFGLAQSVA